MSSTIEDMLIRMIKAIDLFKWITDEEALELSKSFVLVFYPTWAFVIKEDTSPNKVFLLKNWLLEVRKSKWLGIIVLGEINPWELLWEMSYLNKSKTMASVFALKNSDVWEISCDKLDFFLEKYPHIKNVFYETMTRREKENKWKLALSSNMDVDSLNLEIWL